MASNKERLVLEIDVDGAGEAGSAIGRIRGHVRQIGDEAQRSSRGMARLAQSTDKLRGMVSGFAAVGAVAAFARMTKQTLDFADAIGKAADRVGISTKSLQELRYAAANAAGLGWEQLDTAMERFSGRVGEAASGTGELRKVLDQYGISVRDSEGRVRALEEILGDLAEATLDAGSSQEQLRIAFSAFGSEDAGLVNLLRLGRDGMAALRSEADVLGESMIRSAEQINAEWTRLLQNLSTKFQSFLLQVVSGWREIGQQLKFGLSLDDAGLSLSPEITKLNAELVRARENLERLQNAQGRNRASRQEILDAEARVLALEARIDAAKQRLARSRSRVPDLAAAQAEIAGTGSGRAGVKDRKVPDLRAGLSRAGDNVSRIVREAAEQAGIPVELLYAVWGLESSFGTNTRLTNKSTGAFGPFQFLPETGARYGVSPASGFEAQAAASARYLADILRTELVGGDMGRALMAYHGGENSDSLWGPKTRGYARAGLDVIDQARGLQTVVRINAEAERSAQAFADAQKKQNALLAEAAALYERTRTPAEEYAATVQRLVGLYESGALDELGGMETLQRGIQAALAEFDRASVKLDEIGTKAQGVKSAFYDFGQVFSSALEDAVVSGGRLSDVLDGLMQDLLRIVARLVITNQIMNAFGSAFGGGNFQPLPTLFATGGRMVAGVGPGIYSSPLYFPMVSPRKFATGGVGVLGEAGPEAVVPLPDGKSIPVQMQGAGAQVEINVIEAPGQGGGRRERQGSGGQRIIDVLVERVRGDMAQDVATGGGLARALESQYGLNRAAGGF